MCYEPAEILKIPLFYPKIPMEQIASPHLYDVQKEPLIFSKNLMDILLKTPYPGDTISLFCFYYYTAKWQHTNQIKATTAYTAKGLHWSEQRVRKVKKKLSQLSLIEDIVTCNEENKITGHYIWVNILPDIKLAEKSSENPIKSPHLRKTTPRTLHTVGRSRPNAYKNNNKMLKEKSNEIHSDKIFSDRKVIPPTLEMVMKYCSQRKNSIDPVEFINFYEAKGWLIGNNKMKDWQASVRTWEQRGSYNRQVKQPKNIIKYGDRWYLNPKDGKYYNNEGNLLEE